MEKSKIAVQKSLITVKCPYCGEKKSIVKPRGNGMFHISCNACDKRFVVEKLARGFHVYTIAEKLLAIPGL
jgi:transcription elongation factor Elf1